VFKTGLRKIIIFPYYFFIPGPFQKYFKIVYKVVYSIHQNLKNVIKLNTLLARITPNVQHSNIL